MNVTKEQIQEVINEIEQRKQMIERLSENPNYVDYTKIQGVLQKGQQVADSILAETKVVSKLEKKAKDMIDFMKNLEQSTQPNQMPVQEEQQQAPVQQTPSNLQPQQPIQQVQQQPVQQQQQEKTPEMIAQENFKAKPEEIGIEEELEIDGLPDLVEEDENDEKKIEMN